MVKADADKGFWGFCPCAASCLRARRGHACTDTLANLCRYFTAGRRWVAGMGISRVARPACWGALQYERRLVLAFACLAVT